MEMVTAVFLDLEGGEPLIGGASMHHPSRESTIRSGSVGATGHRLQSLMMLIR